MYVYVCIQSIYTVCNIMAKLVFQELVWGRVGGLFRGKRIRRRQNQGITVYSQQSRKQVVDEQKGNRMEMCWENMQRREATTV